MQLETKFFRLRTQVTIGSRFGEWKVCWLGGWAKNRLYFMVMLVKISNEQAGKEKRRRATMARRR